MQKKIPREKQNRRQFNNWKDDIEVHRFQGRLVKNIYSYVIVKMMLFYKHVAKRQLSLNVYRNCTSAAFFVHS